MTKALVHDATGVDAIVRSAATGDEVAFARLVEAHHASMARVAYVICNDDDTTRDAVQSAWAIAWRRMSSLHDPGQVRPWLIAIAANEARQAMRRQRRSRVVDISDDIDRPGGRDPEESVDLVDLRRSLRGLTADERSLLAMRYAAGLDSADIGRQLGITASGVRSRLARLLDRLRLDLALEPEDDR